MNTNGGFNNGINADGSTGFNDPNSNAYNANAYNGNGGLNANNGYTAAPGGVPSTLEDVNRYNNAINSGEVRAQTGSVPAGAYGAGTGNAYGQQDAGAQWQQSGGAPAVGKLADPAKYPVIQQSMEPHLQVM